MAKERRNNKSSRDIENMNIYVKFTPLRLIWFPSQQQHYTRNRNKIYEII